MKKFLLFFSILVSFVTYSQGHETFENFDRTGTSYGGGTFEGQDGSTWEYSECRGDIELNDKAITLGRNRSNPIFVESGTISGGIGTLEFSYMQAFSTNVNLQVYVNDDLVYTATSDDEEDVIKNSGPITIDVAGDIVLKFAKNNSSGQVTIDDVIWTAYSSNPDPDPSDACSQATAANDIEDGYGHLHLTIIANDFIVDQGEAFTLEQVKMNVIVESGLNVDNANLTFYEPSSQGPGALITTQNTITPSAQTTVNNLGAYEVKEVTFDLPAPITFEATNSSDKIYWMGVNIGYSGNESYLEVSSLYSTPNEAYQSLDDGLTWESTVDYGELLHGVIEFSGTCEELDDDPTPPGECEWTVIVEEDYYGDEVAWELRTMDGTVLLSGGDYGDGYYDEQTVTAEGPLEFWITNDGFFGDNTPTYSVSNGTQVLVSGIMPMDGDTLTFSDLNCGEDDDDPTPPGDDCSFGISSTVDVPNAYNITMGNDFHTADDFIVEAGVTFTLENIYINTNQQGVPTNVIINIHEDNGGFPGTVLHTITTSPDDSEVVGSAFGDPIYLLTFDLDTPIEFEEGTYWINPKMSAPGDEVVWLAVTDEESYGAVARRSQDGGLTWEIDTDGVNVVMSVSGTCEGDDDDPTPPGDDCAQGDDSNNFENGFNIVAGGDYRNADDFYVSAGNTLTLESIELNIFADAPITSLNIDFYNDANGSPGSTIVESLTGLIPYAQVPVGGNFGYTVYSVFVEVDVEFEGGDAGTTYWMSPSAVSDVAFWEVSSAGTLGSPVHTSEENGPWEADDEGSQAVFKLHCETATPPPTQCLFDITSSVEPITRVIVANVDNSSSPTSSEALEDFTDIEIYMEAGQSYEVSMEGNTDGPYTNYFTAFIDVSGDWSDYLTYEIGSITGSTGTDGQQATATITVPAEAIDGAYTVRIIKNYNVSPTNPCGMYSFGQAEDYTLIIGEIDDCTGTPEAGITSVSPTTGNVGTTYTVTNTGHDFADGMSYQWQSNTDGTGWVDEGDATGTYSSYTATAPDELDIEVEWRLAVTCVASNETAYSDTAVFTTVFQYCTPGGTNSSYYIDSFTTTDGIININNTNSGFSTGGYGDFYDDHTVAQVPGQDISFLAEFPTGQTYGLRIWVDWNQDGEFDETEEVAWNSTSYLNPHSGSFTVPADALPGETRMRIVGHWLNSSAEISPCSTNHAYGEFEDYKFIVEELDDCTGTPDAGITTVSPATGNIGTNYTVSNSGHDFGNGMSYQWQSNTDGAGWVEEGDATDSYASYTATAPNEIDVEVEWRLAVTCLASNETSYSDSATFTTTMEYCTPSMDCTDGDVITNVTFQEIDNDSGCSPDGYGDYTHLSATVQAGGTYPISVTVGDGWTEHVFVWIDFGNDGTFGPEDYMGEVGEGGRGVTLDGEISIPGDIEDGEYRMRVLVWAGPTQDDPCVSSGFGEAEDYTVIVDGVVGINDNAYTNFSYYPNPAETTLYLKSDIKIESVSGYNVLGQKVISNNQFNNGQVDVSNLSSGAYLFEVIFENGTTETFRVLRK